MSVISDGRFWAGVIVAIVGMYAWHRYQASKAS